MTKPIIFIAFLALAGAMNLGASAQGASPDVDVYAAKKADCEQKADVRNFGIHFSERYRFVMRCIAGLSYEGG